jgi:hypothetical protein
MNDPIGVAAAQQPVPLNSTSRPEEMDTPRKKPTSPVPMELGYELTGNSTVQTFNTNPHPHFDLSSRQGTRHDTQAAAGWAFSNAFWTQSFPSEMMGPPPIPKQALSDPVVQERTAPAVAYTMITMKPETTSVNFSEYSFRAQSISNAQRVLENAPNALAPLVPNKPTVVLPPTFQYPTSSHPTENASPAEGSLTQNAFAVDSRLCSKRAFGEPAEGNIMASAESIQGVPKPPQSGQNASSRPDLFVNISAHESKENRVLENARNAQTSLVANWNPPMVLQPPSFQHQTSSHAAEGMLSKNDFAVDSKLGTFGERADDTKSGDVQAKQSMASAESIRGVPTLPPVRHKASSRPDLYVDFSEQEAKQQRVLGDLRNACATLASNRKVQVQLLPPLQHQASSHPMENASASEGSLAQSAFVADSRLCSKRAFGERAENSKSGNVHRNRSMALTESIRGAPELPSIRHKATSRPDLYVDFSDYEANQQRVLENCRIACASLRSNWKPAVLLLPPLQHEASSHPMENASAAEGSLAQNAIAVDSRINQVEYATASPIVQSEAKGERTHHLHFKFYACAAFCIVGILVLATLSFRERAKTMGESGSTTDGAGTSSGIVTLVPSPPIADPLPSLSVELVPVLPPPLAVPTSPGVPSPLVVEPSPSFSFELLPVQPPAALPTDRISIWALEPPTATTTEIATLEPSTPMVESLPSVSFEIFPFWPPTALPPDCICSWATDPTSSGLPSPAILEPMPSVSVELVSGGSPTALPQDRIYAWALRPPIATSPGVPSSPVLAPTPSFSFELVPVWPITPLPPDHICNWAIVPVAQPTSTVIATLVPSENICAWAFEQAALTSTVVVTPVRWDHVCTWAFAPATPKSAGFVTHVPSPPAVDPPPSISFQMVLVLAPTALPPDRIYNWAFELTVQPTSAIIVTLRICAWTVEPSTATSTAIVTLMPSTPLPSGCFELLSFCPQTALPPDRICILALETPIATSIGIVTLVSSSPVVEPSTDFSFALVPAVPPPALSSDHICGWAFQLTEPSSSGIVKLAPPPLVARPSQGFAFELVPVLSPSALSPGCVCIWVLELTEPASTVIVTHVPPPHVTEPSSSFSFELVQAAPTSSGAPSVGPFPSLAVEFVLVLPPTALPPDRICAWGLDLTAPASSGVPTPPIVDPSQSLSGEMARGLPLTAMPPDSTLLPATSITSPIANPVPWTIPRKVYWFSLYGCLVLIACVICFLSREHSGQESCNTTVEDGMATVGDTSKATSAPATISHAAAAAGAAPSATRTTSLVCAPAPAPPREARNVAAPDCNAAVDGLALAIAPATAAAAMSTAAFPPLPPSASGTTTTTVVAPPVPIQLDIGSASIDFGADWPDSSPRPPSQALPAATTAFGGIGISSVSLAAAQNNNSIYTRESRSVATSVASAKDAPFNLTADATASPHAVVADTDHAAAPVPTVISTITDSATAVPTVTIRVGNVVHVQITGFRSNFTGEPRIVWEEFSSSNVSGKPITLYRDLQEEFVIAKKWVDTLMEMLLIKKVAGVIRDDQINDVKRVGRRIGQYKYYARWNRRKIPFNLETYNSGGEAYFSKLLFDSYMSQSPRKAYPASETNGKELRVKSARGKYVPIGKFTSDKRYVHAKWIARQSAQEYTENDAWRDHVKQTVRDIYGST